MKDRHKPFVQEVKNSDTMIIFIHGIVESPYQFRNLAQIAMDNNISVCGVLLAGHGKSGKDFVKSNLNMWRTSIEREIEKYKTKYKNIILVGHSMGALLSIEFYLKYKQNIKYIVAIATPLCIRVKFNIIRSCIKIALGIIPKGDLLTRYAYEAISVNETNLFNYIKWAPRYIDLFKLIIKVRLNLNNIDIPMLIFHSMNDELVSLKSIKIYKKSFKYNNKLNNKSIIKLESSGHFYYDYDDLEVLESEFKSFI
ncbi:alpha/beta hydrolase [Romboutsia sp. Marseille-P6047]|nr:alpha/beta hydrolase [Romboutsia sp. Marseille-P6047]